MKKYVILLLSLILLSFACWSFKDKIFSLNQSGSDKTDPTLTKSKKLIIKIQPFSDISEEQVNYVANELKKVYSSVEINKPIPLPEHCKNNARKRYRADSLINYLSDKTEEGYLTIGLTTKDISTTKGKIADWGIMGLGFCPGNSCIASLYRLHGENRMEKLYKVAIHELGHTNGLQHCLVKTCLMRDAEGKDRLDEEKEFCVSCKAMLIKAGLALK